MEGDNKEDRQQRRDKVRDAWREEIRKEKRKKKEKNLDWPQQMPLFCRGCSDATGTVTYVPLKDFQQGRKTDMFKTIVARGMERFCVACQKSRMSATSIEDDCTDAGLDE